MRKQDHHLPATGPQSDPVIFGISRGLEELFPPVTHVPAATSRDGDESQAGTPPADGEASPDGHGVPAREI